MAKRGENSTQEEYQQLFQLLYSHFNNSNLVGVKYEEEDPHTWPSNWKRQAPLMILKPDAYVDNRPQFNTYQKQLVRRLSLKYQPLVRYYRQCIRSSNSSAMDNNNNNSSNSYYMSDDRVVAYTEKKSFRKLPNVAIGWNKVKKMYIRK